MSSRFRAGGAPLRGSRGNGLRRRLRQGDWRCLWDGRDVPASHDVVAECRLLLLPIETELRRIEAVFGAELYDTGATDDDRANAVAH